MIRQITYSKTDKPERNKKEEIINFLYENLEEFRDPKDDIEKCIDYALGKDGGYGGLIITAEKHDKIIGCVVTNETGMKDYIPENILVYIATHKKHRGKGVAKELMHKIIDNTRGNIALHVEPDNPAIFLYRNLGFTYKYIEMRLIKSNK